MGHACLFREVARAEGPISNFLRRRNSRFGRFVPRRAFFELSTSLAGPPIYIVNSFYMIPQYDGALWPRRVASLYDSPMNYTSNGCFFVGGANGGSAFWL